MSIISRVRRYVGEKPATYRVIGLVIIKPQVDLDSGEMGMDLDLRMGDLDDPVKFLSFFHHAQKSLVSDYTLLN
ncbi:hypothetical protein [Brevibacillus centrosporus]|uniref:hypothetical protein n=1 Tax=Brevibacillus centrosporus TaxID=54910 RepID=UPI003B01C1EA